MNTKMVAALSTMLIGVSACTTTPAPPGDASVSTLTNVERYQAAVNAQAASKNVDVRWVNPPDDDDLDEYTTENKTNGKADID